MTFNAGVPNANQPPDQFPTQNQANMQRLKAIIQTDHQFNDAGGATNDGYHNLINMLPQAAPGPTAGRGKFYGKTFLGTIQPFYQKDAGVETFLMPVAAFVLADNTGAIVNSKALNVTNITHAAPGDGIYTVNFTNNLGTTEYLVDYGFMSSTNSDRAKTCFVAAKTATTITLNFNEKPVNSSGNVRPFDPDFFNVIIYLV